MPRAKPKAKAMREPRCQCCIHDERWRIELLRAGGASLDSLAKKFGVHRDSIHRHWANHVSAEMKASYLAGPAQLQELAAKAADSGASVLDNLNAVRVVLMSSLAATAEAGDGRSAAYIGGQLTAVLTTIARVTGELSVLAANTININNSIVLGESPAFLQMQAAMLRALAPFPDARAAVVAALRDFDPAAPGAMKVIDHVGK